MGGGHLQATELPGSPGELGSIRTACESIQMQGQTSRDKGCCSHWQDGSCDLESRGSEREHGGTHPNKRFQSNAGAKQADTVLGCINQGIFSKEVESSLDLALV